MAENTARAGVKPTVTAQREPAAGKKAGANGPAPAPAANAPLGVLYSAGPALGLAPAVQAKVVVGPPDDPFEREADHVAERVTSGDSVMRISRLPANGLSAAAQRLAAGGLLTDVTDGTDQRPIQRQAAEEEEEPAQTLAVQRQAEIDEEEEPAQMLAVQRQLEVDGEEEPAQTLAVQRVRGDEEEQPVQSQSGGGAPSMTAAAARAIHGRGAGEALLPATRASLERSLGVDLGDVRVHATGSANAAARALRARAFTHRNHIWLGAGESQADLKLMAHETAHVLQQDGVVRRKPAQADPKPEDERSQTGPANGAGGALPAAPAVVLPGRPGALARPANGKLPVWTAPSLAGEPAPGAEQLLPEAEEEPVAADEMPVPIDAELAAGETPPPAGATGGAPVAPPAAPAQPAASGGDDAPQRSPASPQEDPAFQQTLGKIKKTRKMQASHSPASDKVDEVTAAAVLPEGEQETRNAESGHLADMNATAEATEQKEESSPSFTPESFKELLKSNLAELERQLPQSESQAKDFKREKPLEGIKQNIGGQVAAENTKITGPMAAQVKQDAPPSDQPVQTPQKVVEELAGDAPRPISPAAAAPKPMLDSEISMAPESQSLDDKMAEEGITEQQLAESNEPNFVEALDTKRQAQQQAVEAPGRYREQETATLAGARGRAKAAGAEGFGAMLASRGQAFSGVFGKQTASRPASSRPTRPSRSASWASWSASTTPPRATSTLSWAS